MGKLQKIKYSAEKQNHGHFDENVPVPKFKEFAILISSSGLLLTLCPLQKINLRSEMMCLRIMRF